MWKLLPAAAGAPGRRVREAAGRELVPGAAAERWGPGAAERASGPSCSPSGVAQASDPRRTRPWVLGSLLGAPRKPGGGVCLPRLDQLRPGCEPRHG